MKKTPKLQRSLIRSYSAFALALGLIVIAIIEGLYSARGKLVRDTVAGVEAAQLVQPDYTRISSRAVEGYGGTLEVLDENLQVVYARGRDTSSGEKNSPAASAPSTLSAKRYTHQELLELLYDDGIEHDGYASLAPFDTLDGRRYHLLVRIPGSYVASETRLKAATEEQTATLLRWISLSAVLLAGVFAANVMLYGRYTARRIARPVTAVSGAMRQIALGTYKERLNFEANAELMEMQRSFNRMADRLERSEQDTKRLENGRRRLLLDLSHDLKTPVTSIQGYAEALRFGYVKDETQLRRAAVRIHDQAVRIGGMVDDLFELTKLETPDAPLQLETFDAGELCLELAEEYEESFADKNITFDALLPDLPLRVEADVRLLRRALANLLGNAVRYCGPGTSVRLSASAAEAGTVRIAVEDDGPGIPDPLKDEIFEPFVRADRARSDGGTGLGLAIARRTAERHGGSLTLDASNGQTRFVLELPRLS